MSARAWLAGLVLAAGCAIEPPATAPAAPPSAPVLRFDADTTRFPSAALHGESDDATLVRLYVDQACAGAPYREVTVDALRAGVLVELLPGGPSVFTARAWNFEGTRSDCSVAASITWKPQGAPPAPSLKADDGVTRRPLMRLSGLAPLADAVHITVGSCQGREVAVVSPLQFMDGVMVELNPRATLYFYAFSTDDVGLRSPCSGAVAVTEDLEAPAWGGLVVHSPNPSSDVFARLEWTGPYDVVLTELFSGPRCTGFRVSACTDAAAFGGCLFDFDATRIGEMEPSVRARDGAGNVTCYEVSEPVVYLPNLPRSHLELRQRGDGFYELRVPYDVATVEVFQQPDCEGPAVTMDGWTASQRGHQKTGVGLSMRPLGDRSPEGCASAP